PRPSVAWAPSPAPRCDGTGRPSLGGRTLMPPQSTLDIGAAEEHDARSSLCVRYPRDATRLMAELKRADSGAGLFRVAAAAAPDAHRLGVVGAVVSRSKPLST